MGKKLKTFWLSYDLGIRGDYDGLYSWLDNQEAKECGDSLAVFSRETDDDFLKVIERELITKVKFNSSDRIYIIWYDISEKKVKGRFIIGSRKRPPWRGYGWSTEEESNIDE
jgi:hypothetical protein